MRISNLAIAIALFMSVMAMPAIAQDYIMKPVNGKNVFFFTKFNVDDTTMHIPADLPDGHFQVSWPDGKKKYRFYVKNGMISGQFEAWLENGRQDAIGTYMNDSLWTFRHGYGMDSDSTFKAGMWQYNVTLENGLKEIKNRHYHLDWLPKTSKGRYYDVWHFDNGHKMEERLFDVEGLVVEKTKYFNNGKPASKEVVDLEKNLMGTIRWNASGEKVHEQFQKIK